MDTAVPINGQYEDTSSVSLMARAQYERHVAWVEAIGTLEREEEVRLLRRIVRARNEPGNAHVQMLARYARERLVEGYQTLVISIARRYSARLRGLEFLDLVQEGNIGLLEAIERYEERELSPSLSGLASLCIRSAIINACYDGNSTFRVPSYIRVQLAKMYKVEHALRQEGESELSVVEVAKRMGIREVEVLDLWAFRAHRDAGSIQGLLREDESEDRYNFVSLFQSAADEENERKEKVRERVQSALDELSPRQCEIARFRYGFDGGLPLRTTHVFEGGVHLCSTYAIADEMGISRGAASSMLCEGNKRLRQSLASLYDECEEAIA